MFLVSDDRTFMERLQRQMELIEEVKAYQRAESRKNKLMSLKMLVVGVVFLIDSSNTSVQVGESEEAVNVLGDIFSDESYGGESECDNGTHPGDLS